MVEVSSIEKSHCSSSSKGVILDSSGCLPLAVLQACFTRRRPQGRPQLADGILYPLWEHLGISQEELQSVTVEMEARLELMSLVPEDQGLICKLIYARVQIVGGPVVVGGGRRGVWGFSPRNF